jgi:hypothetical protein
MACYILLLEPCCESFLFSKVFKEFMGYVNVAFHFIGVFEQKGPNSSMVRHCKPYSNLDKGKGVSCTV